MNTTDLMKYYDCKTRRALSEKIEFSEVTLWKWEKKGIPVKTQAFLQVKTKGKLKADLSEQPLIATA